MLFREGSQSSKLSSTYKSASSSRGLWGTSNGFPSKNWYLIETFGAQYISRVLFKSKAAGANIK